MNEIETKPQPQFIRRGDEFSGEPPSPEGNYWAIKLRRQLRHNHGILFGLFTVAVAEAIFLLDHYRYELTHYYTIIPYWGVLLPILCAMATLSLDFGAFSRWISLKYGSEPELNHFLELSAIAPRRVFTALLQCHFTLYFIMVLAIIPAILLIYVNYQVMPQLIFALLNCAFASLLVILTINSGIFRLDTLMLGVITIILIITLTTDRISHPGILLTVLVILCAARSNAFLINVGARRCVAVDRLIEAALIVVALITQNLAGSYRDFPLWSLALIAAASSVADLETLLNRRRRPKRWRFQFPEPLTSMLWSILCCGSAALLIFFILKTDTDTAFFFIMLLGTMVTSGNLALLVTCLVRDYRVEKLFPGMIVIIYMLLMALLMIIGALSGLLSATCYLYTSLIIWGVALLTAALLSLFWPKSVNGSSRQ